MSFFLDTDNNAEDSAVVVSDGTRDDTFNFFGSSASKEENEPGDIFGTVFNQSTGDNDDSNARDNPFSSPSAKKLKLAENVSKAPSVNRSAKVSDCNSEIKRPSSLSMQKLKQGGAIRNPKMVQNPSTRNQSSRNGSNEKPQEDSTSSDRKRNREALICNNGPVVAATSQPRGLPLRGQYTHSMQLNNEQSPPGTCFQLPTVKEQSETSNEPLKSNMNPQKSTSSLCEKLLARHSMSAPSMHQSSVEGAGQTSTATETKDLAEALKSLEYEALKDQLSNLTAAKQAGKFTQQVALSVEALFQCTDRIKSKRLTTLQNSQTGAKEKICRMHDALASELQQIDDYHQAIVDQKLSQLSTVLHEITTTQEELAKFKQLLRSLTADLSAEQ